jgi:hypothetical protein
MIEAVGEFGRIGALAVDRQTRGGLLECVAVVRVGVLTLARVAHRIADGRLQLGEAERKVGRLAADAKWRGLCGCQGG